MSAAPHIRSFHAKQRCAERVGLELSDADVKAILSKIRAGESIALWRGEKAEKHCLTYAGKAMTCIVSPGAGALITVMERPGKRPMDRRAG